MAYDIRWIQRFNNYQKALIQLQDAVDLANERPLSKLEKQGLIQSFEYTHELAWNVMKDYFEYQGNSNIRGSRDAIREAFRRGLVEEGQVWMDTIKSRNKSSHTYNEEVAEKIVKEILTIYFDLFTTFKQKMLDIQANEEEL